MTPLLLSRDDFRQQVFGRDKHLCVVCGRQGADAHHIIERRLWSDGGYYLDNGATLCPEHHLRAESTEISAQDIRQAAGITRVTLPAHLYPDETYDKWGNVILPNGRRLKGELFDDESVQRVIEPVLELFDAHVKYPRTWHLPWSPGVSSDDRVLSDSRVADWNGTEVVITEKMDGENTTLYRDYMHARSVDYSSHVTRNWMKGFHAAICGEIPDGMRICGENLSYKHSIGYDKLPSFFMVFSVWQGTTCLSWDETLEWCALLNLYPVPQLYRGDWAELTRNGQTAMYWYLMAQAGAGNTGLVHEGDPPQREVEGYVVRPAGSFTLREFSSRVGKYVRKNHVTTHGHWMRSRFEPNSLA